MQYQPYPEHRNSGIEWLGDIPNHWDVKKFRFLFSFGRGLGITKANLLDEGVPCINYGEVHSKYGFEVVPEKHPLKCVAPDYLETGVSSLLSNGDFVFADTSEDVEGSGNFSHLNSDTPTFAGYHTVIARPISDNSSRYIAYLFDSLRYRYQIRKSVSGVKVFSITQEILKNCYLWLPPIKEQNHIVRFLDHKTQQIDQLITKKQTLIDKLNEQRIALITHAVTKGLNPDVEMKDSGVEWLGKVPEHWNVVRIKMIARIRYGLSEPPEYIEDGLPLVRATDVFRGKIDTSKMKRVREGDIDWKRNVPLKAGEIIIVRSGAYTGDSAIVPGDLEGSVAGFDMVLTAQNANSHFLAYALLSRYMLDGQIFLAKTRAAQPHLNAEDLGGFNFVSPPIEEQTQIVEYLDGKTARIDRMIGLNQQTIDKLKEYRTALITAAVTGKIDVRKWQEEANHATP